MSRNIEDFESTILEIENRLKATAFRRRKPGKSVENDSDDVFPIKDIDNLKELETSPNYCMHDCMLMLVLNKFI